MLFELVNLALRSGGPIGQGMAELLRAALRESGYRPAGPCADADILRMLELTGSSLPRDEAQADAHAPDRYMATIRDKLGHLSSCTDRRW